MFVKLGTLDHLKDLKKERFNLHLLLAIF